jgi:Ca2+-binding RTX toxin-like protein
VANKYGTSGKDWVFGSNDGDYLFGYGGDDLIAGFGGDDWILGGAGADVLIGGSGSDTANYSDSLVGVWVSLYTHVGHYGSAEGDQLYEIENLVGSMHDDILDGDDNANGLFGLDGNDVLLGRGGDDYFYGGNGDDWLLGGTGDDTLYGAGDNDNLLGGAGADLLDGSVGNDTAYYAGSPVGVFVSLYANAGFSGDAEGDKLSGIENLSGSAFNDILAGDNNANDLSGMDGIDDLVGYDGEDSLHGGNNDDWLFGGAAVDTLYGDSGNDKLYGGPGGDTMYGGSGADTFAWMDPAESAVGFWFQDLIKDFNRAEGDLLDLSAIDTNFFAAGDQAFTFIGDASHPFTAPGQVSWYISGDPAGGNNTYILLNTDLDAYAEGVIEVAGVHAVDASWFVL